MTYIPLQQRIDQKRLIFVGTRLKYLTSPISFWLQIVPIWGHLDLPGVRQRGEATGMSEIAPRQSRRGPNCLHDFLRQSCLQVPTWAWTRFLSWKCSPWTAVFQWKHVKQPNRQRTTLTSSYSTPCLLQAGWLQFEAGAHAHIMAQHSTEEMQIILYRTLVPDVVRSLPLHLYLRPYITYASFYYAGSSRFPNFLWAMWSKNPSRVMVWTLWGWHNLCRWESRVTTFCLEVARSHPDTRFLFASLLYQYTYKMHMHFEIVVLFQQVQVCDLLRSSFQLVLRWTWFGALRCTSSSCLCTSSDAGTSAGFTAQ